MKKVLIIFCVTHFVASVLVFDCIFDLELFFDEMKVVYTCSLPDGEKHGRQVTNATHRDITDVIGPHMKDPPNVIWNNTDVRQIHIFKHKFEYFPRGLTDFFENIEAIHAGMNALAFLEKDDMKIFTKLRFLYLYNNVLQSLKSDVLEDNLDLQYVSFYGNQLAHIGSNLLTPLKSLKTAYFNKNVCIDLQAVHNLRDLAEIKLEISQRCSDITDEDLMQVLKQNNEKLINLEMKMSQLSEQLSDFMSSNRTEL